MPVSLQHIPIKVLPSQVSRATKAYKRAADIAAHLLVLDLEQTHATWRTPVRWIVKIRAHEVEVRTKSQVWAYVDQGTRPHIIRPRRRRRLVFRAGYRAKTRPGSIVSGAGGPFGPIVVARQVLHPGTKARGFTQRLRAKWNKKWPHMLQRAIAEALQ